MDIYLPANQKNQVLQMHAPPFVRHCHNMLPICDFTISYVFLEFFWGAGLIHACALRGQESLVTVGKDRVTWFNNYWRDAYNLQNVEIAH